MFHKKKRNLVGPVLLPCWQTALRYRYALTSRSYFGGYLVDSYGAAVLAGRVIWGRGPMKRDPCLPEIRTQAADDETACGSLMKCGGKEI